MIELHEMIYNDVWVERPDMDLGNGIELSGGDKGTYDTICKLNTLSTLSTVEREKDDAKDASLD